MRSPQALAQLPRIDMLILNAATANCPKASTKDGFELQIGAQCFRMNSSCPEALLCGNLLC